MIVIGILMSALKFFPIPHENNFGWEKKDLITVITLLLK